MNIAPGTDVYLGIGARQAMEGSFEWTLDFDPGDFLNWRAVIVLSGEVTVATTYVPVGLAVAVPEPPPAALLALGTALLGLMARRRR